MNIEIFQKPGHEARVYMDIPNKPRAPKIELFRGNIFTARIKAKDVADAINSMYLSSLSPVEVLDHTKKEFRGTEFSYVKEVAARVARWDKAYKQAKEEFVAAVKLIRNGSFTRQQVYSRTADILKETSAR